MSRSGKRMNAIREQLEPGKAYSLDEALELLKGSSKVKFTESVDVAIRLGIDPRKSDQNVRGSTVLPNGTGKTVRVAVFTQGENADKAKEAGADVVGMDDLHDQIKEGDMAFDVVIATPDAMRVVGKLGQLLGPRGLMPNPKVGTVTTDVEQAVKNAKAGQVRFRTDKAGIIHSTIGKVDFEVDALKGNLNALVKDLVKLKPAASKGSFLQKVALSTTMGPGILVDRSTLDV
ncbi:MAG: 50S ribosomal protein L1 [Gammaproteobacteria bacterium]|nr:50S ribosomal protein L1 [Gammaproteobacteria bacterium]NNJ80037.1 50S ribosomal protein L1 [Xanthomonadales bacterium]